MAIMTSDARQWITAYLAAHPSDLTASQIKTLRTVRRAPETAAMTVTDLAATMRETLELSPTQPKPIRQIGAASAAYILGILEQ